MGPLSQIFHYSQLLFSSNLHLAQKGAPVRFKASSLKGLEGRHNAMAYSECHYSDEGVETISHGMITSMASKNNVMFNIFTNTSSSKSQRIEAVYILQRVDWLIAKLLSSRKEEHRSICCDRVPRKRGRGKICKSPKVHLFFSLYILTLFLLGISLIHSFLQLIGMHMGGDISIVQYLKLLKRLLLAIQSSKTSPNINLNSYFKILGSHVFLFTSTGYIVTLGQ